MPEFSDLDNFVVAPSATTVTAIDTGDRSGNAVTLKAHPSNTVAMYVGRSTNKAAAALSDTTGFPLSPGESISLDLVMGEDRPDGGYPACYTTGSSQKLCVLVLKP